MMGPHEHIMSMYSCPSASQIEAPSPFSKNGGKPAGRCATFLWPYIPPGTVVADRARNDASALFTANSFVDCGAFVSWGRHSAGSNRLPHHKLGRMPHFCQCGHLFDVRAVVHHAARNGNGRLWRMAEAPKTRYARGEARIAQIRAAAIKLIYEEGILSVTHRAVAKRANLSASAPSFFFPSIDDLIVEAFRSIMKSMFDDLEALSERILREDM